MGDQVKIRTGRVDMVGRYVTSTLAAKYAHVEVILEHREHRVNGWIRVSFSFNSDRACADMMSVNLVEAFRSKLKPDFLDDVLYLANDEAERAAHKAREMVS